MTRNNFFYLTYRKYTIILIYKSKISPYCH